MTKICRDEKYSIKKISLNMTAVIPKEKIVAKIENVLKKTDLK